MIRFAALLAALTASVAATAAVPTADGKMAIEIGSALARNDWSAVTKLVAIQDIGQDERAPLLAPGAIASPAVYSAFLSTCGLFGMGVDGAGALNVDFENNKVSNPTAIQVAWICPNFDPVTAHISKIDGRFKIKFDKQKALQGDIDEYKRSKDNRRLIEAFQNGSIADRKFELGSGLKGEPKQRGEPTDTELSQVALKYFADLAATGGQMNNRGLDYIDFTKLSWEDKESTKFKPLSFEEVRQRLRACRAQSGWPRRYDRNGARVFAFDSQWVCLGTSGPYVLSVFLEIASGRVSGGRIILNKGDDLPSVSAPAARMRS